MTGVSFVWSVLHTWIDQPVAYFHPGTRAWEFGVGALVALGAGRALRLTDRGERVLGWAGLTLLLKVLSSGGLAAAASAAGSSGSSQASACREQW